MSYDSDGYYDDYELGGCGYEEYGGGGDQHYEDQFAEYHEDQAECFQNFGDQLVEYRDDQVEDLQDQVEHLEDQLAEYHADQVEYSQDQEEVEEELEGETDERWATYREEYEPEGTDEEEPVDEWDAGSERNTFSDERGMTDQEEVTDEPEGTDGGELVGEWDSESERNVYSDRRGTTDQEEATEGPEETDEGEPDDKWDTEDEGGTYSEGEEIETDSDDEHWDTEDEENFGGGFYIPPLYSTQAPYWASCYPLQHGSMPGIQAGAGVNSTMKEAGELMKSILDSKPNYKALLQTTGEKAQALLDVMYKLLDDQSTPSDLRNKILRTVIQLCRSSTLYPRCLVLQDVQHGTECEASGAFGDIWIGSYKGHQVCLKVTRTYRKQNVGDLFKIYVKEAIIWSQVFHPNVLPFYGVYHVQGRFSGRVDLVSPWMRNGNIRDYLQANPEVPRRPMINEALAGLMHLHTLKIVHGDIKGINILISPNGSACLADFGLSSLLDTNGMYWTSVQTTNTATGTLRWSAPELLDDIEGDESPKPTFASDVYSMASTMYEILTDKIPFYELRLDVTVISKVIQGSRPTKPPVEQELELSDSLWEVMWDCWSKSPNERPTVSEITVKLHEIPYNEVTIRRMAQHQKTQNNNEVQPLTSQGFREMIRGGGPNNPVAELDLLKQFSK